MARAAQQGDRVNTGYLFTRVLKCGRILPQGITPAAIYGMLQEVQQRAGVAPFSPHDLRRTFVGDLLDAGVDMAMVQRLMGHSSADTTSRYDAKGGGYAIGGGEGQAGGDAAVTDAYQRRVNE